VPEDWVKRSFSHASVALDFFVGVKRVDDDIQQLLNLRLKMMGLGFAHRGVYLINAASHVKQSAPPVAFFGRRLHQRNFVVRHRFGAWRM
jgi:hypothetical protein